MSCKSLACGAILFMLALLTHGETQTPLSNEFECVHPPYKVYVASKSPLLMYLEGFITPEERRHLLELANGTFKHSYVTSDSSQTIHAVRTSQSTSVRRSPTVRCIERRALDLQGLDVPVSNVEPIQLVKYAPTERYHFHTDWFTDAQHAVASLGGNRASSIFGYIKAEGVVGGGTNFPFLDAKSGEWCKFVDCDEEYEKGVTFRPVEGNAVFWENMVSGKGDERVLHAGLPVVRGEKVGMNIWVREGKVPDELRGL
ncbi:hypothetical protein H634G_02397 [Metarhizium anisopliae BRIP 53293]|uniref:Fe2OG dioxygenase domain-containing protein n=1 Tax=Metarhizium anisopliae BRIP 53293 TaxID=1291518 RepID=A0A0D9P7T3_METAN|nr:hypothetical protein H634G_02397 [Metarhizium anisopliae BRIP 53293]KJK91190.1 hypothetical protein H633G_04938 [Metarhizium anisopliae BRIP 53284]